MHQKIFTTIIITTRLYFENATAIKYTKRFSSDFYPWSLIQTRCISWCRSETTYGDIF